MKGSVGNLEIPDCQTAICNHAIKIMSTVECRYINYMDEETAKVVLSRDIIFFEIKTLKASMPKHLPKEPGTLEYDASQFS